MISLTDEDGLKILESDYVYSRVKKIDFSFGSFYVKFCSETEAFKELVAKKVFDLVNINCPKYYYLSNFGCVLSEDLNNDNFKYISEYCYDDFLTLKLLKELISVDIDNIDEVNLQINVMHFIDILFSNIDRHDNNYGLFIDENRNGKITVFDNGLFFDYLKLVTIPCCSDNIDVIKSKSSEFEYFINNISFDHRCYINELFFKFNPFSVELIFHKIEREYNYKFKCKNKLLINYIKNYISLIGVMMKNIDVYLVNDYDKKRLR